MLNTVVDWLNAGLLAVGVVFMFLGAVAIVRMPDVFMRMQGASKASSLGAGAVFVSIAIHFGSLEGVARAVALIAFTFFTVPVAVHTLGLAAHRTHVPMWPDTRADELRLHQTDPRYRQEAHEGAD